MMEPKRPTLPTQPLQYAAIPSPNPFTQVMLVDKRVPDYETIVSSANGKTFPIVYTPLSSSADLLALLKDNFQSIDRLALCFTTPENGNLAFMDMKSMCDQVCVQELIETFKIKNVDFMGCNTLQFPKWQAYYDLLKPLAEIGASSDETGNLKYGGDWIMETTSEDIELVYFTKAIELYKFLMDTGPAPNVTHSGFSMGESYIKMSFYNDSMYVLDPRGGPTGSGAIYKCDLSGNIETTRNLSGYNVYNTCIADNIAYSMSWSNNRTVKSINLSDAGETFQDFCVLPAGGIANNIIGASSTYTYVEHTNNSWGKHLIVIQNSTGSIVYNSPIDTSCGNYYVNGENLYCTTMYGSDNHLRICMFDGSFNLLVVINDLTILINQFNDNITHIDSGLDFFYSFIIFDNIVYIVVFGYDSDWNVIPFILQLSLTDNSIRIFNTTSAFVSYSSWIGLYNGFLYGIDYFTGDTHTFLLPTPPLAVTSASVSSSSGVISFTNPNAGPDTYSFFYNTDNTFANFGEITSGASWPNASIYSLYIFVQNVTNGLISTGTMVTYLPYHPPPPPPQAPLAITSTSVSDSGVISFTNPNAGPDTYSFFYNADNTSANLGAITSGGSWPDSSKTNLYIFVENVTNGLISAGTMVTYSPTPPLGNVCFPAGTPVLTDQGEVAIEKLDILKHTIQSKPIVAVTHIKSLDDFVVCLEKDCIAPNVPSQQTIISKYHLVEVDNQFIEAYKIPKAIQISYNGELLYNVLLEQHGCMTINNMICETLHPSNGTASLYKFLNQFGNNLQVRQQLIQVFNDGLKKH